MIKTETTRAIDPMAEIDSVVALLQQTWDGNADMLQAVVAESFSAGQRAARHWIDPHAAAVSLSDADKHRRDVLDFSYTQSEHQSFDRTLQDLQRIRCGVDDHHHRSMAGWSFDRAMVPVVQRLAAQHPMLSAVTPRGYAAFLRDYQDFQGLADHDAFAQSQFSGHDLSGTVSHGLSVAVSLPHVAYSDRGQGRHPHVTLMSAVFGHALLLQRHNNTVAVLREIADIPMDSLFESAPTAFGVHGPWLQAICSSAKRPEPLMQLTDDIRAEIAGNEARWAALSPDDRLRARNLAADAIINEVLMEDNGPKM